MDDKACKFGGTSLADAQQMKKVADILAADRRRRFVVVSAPGTRADVTHDRKVTDLLLLCHQLSEQGLDIAPAFAPVRERFESIAEALGVRGVSGWLDEVQTQVTRGVSRDWLASRGEFLNGRLMATYLDARFVDAAEGIFFHRDGRLNGNKSYNALAELLSGKGRFIIPGFYGVDPRGQVKTFPRGGSDITGAIVARAVGAEVYENWTDVPGILMADPRIVAEAQTIRTITYREMRELSYMGASALQHEAVFPVRDAGIPIHIRHTNDPDAPGTWVVRTRDPRQTPQVVIGIAGRVGFSVVFIEKPMMNQERGFGRKVLSVLETHGVSYEHSPTSIDSMSLIISDEELGDKEEHIVEDIKRVTQAETVEVFHDLALIATVGLGMAVQPGVAGRLFGALQEENVNVRMINQGASQINLIVGVANEDFERSVRAIYRAFVTGV
jgi:aspartate kinase